ncbi:beta-lactamase family protein [Tateyamaria omphalii]|uniref:serine hydrolase domain-containing protein n=1 Tax=Tateyamaria omphalii TaxID=299262 RepID=UPI001C99576D|nr:serine hydrolase domain-containing protein [Tateyamaria omphalii]MBY5935175.1 beta-lactamase family protein [Tateyamaria omphalii]
MTTSSTFLRPFRNVVLGLFVVFAALSWVVTASLAAGEVPSDDQWQAELSGFVDGVVTTGLDQDAVAGAVVVVVSGDDVILSRGYRLGDARTGRLMSPEQDVIPLASISKVFTAWAILQLEREGRLTLDDPIAQHLPGLKLDQRFGEVRVRHLLSHTAGLEERYAGYFTTPEAIGAENAIDHISAILPRQVRPPEDVIAYSNASYVLLGEIVAQVAGTPLTDYIAEMLAPHGVYDLRAMHMPKDQNGASPFHVWNAGQYVGVDPTPFPQPHTASGGLALSAENMGRVMQLLLGDTAVDGAGSTAVADLYAPMWPDRPGFTSRTKGLWSETWAGHEVYHHAGSHFGFHTNMVLVPELDLGFFVAANSPGGSALAALPRRVLREVISPDTRPVAERIACDDVCLQEMEGRYMMTRRNTSGLDRLHVLNTHAFDVSATDNGALLVSGLGYPLRFEPIGTDQFETAEGDVPLGFIRDAAGRVVGANLNGGMQTFDRVGFWHSGVSLDSALWATVGGVLFCMIGIALAWRARRSIIGAATWLGAVGLIGVPGCYVIITPIISGRDLSSQASPGDDLWIATGLCVAIALALVWAIARSVVPATRIPLGERGATLAAVACFGWVLVVAWVWNVPTAALTW